MKTESESSPPSRMQVAGAFATVYVLWGSTYLAIRIAVETMPPFLMAGSRFLVAGGVLFSVLRLRGSKMPGRAEWISGCITGFLLLVTGNGAVVWAEQVVPSGLTALLVGLTPVWFALLDWIRPGGTRPQLRTVAGIVVGFGGMLLLVTPNSGTAANHGVPLGGALALLAAGLSWAAGSLIAKHSSKNRSPWMTAALQMICGGLALMVVALAAGEFHRVELARASLRSMIALGYLVVFGSWAGFSAYVWLLKTSKPSHVATYAYVNPVIALLLGNLLLDEPLSARVLLATAVILAGVVIITVPSRVPLPVKPPKAFPTCADTSGTNRTTGDCRTSACRNRDPRPDKL